MARLAAPEGWVLITTPNQLSLLSIGTMVLKHRFSAFQDVHYPAHLTALIEIDLVRMARECGLKPEITYSGSGRIPMTAARWPGWLARALPRRLSDNVMLAARRDDRGER